MKTIKLLLLLVILLMSTGCDLKLKQTNQGELRERKEIQYQKFTSVIVGETLHLTDYSLISPQISYMNKYTTTYKVHYNSYSWYITISNNTKIVRNIRTID